MLSEIVDIAVFPFEERLWEGVRLRYGWRVGQTRAKQEGCPYRKPNPGDGRLRIS